MTKWTITGKESWERFNQQQYKARQKFKVGDKVSWFNYDNEIVIGYVSSLVNGLGKRNCVTVRRNPQDIHIITRPTNLTLLGNK